MPRPLRRNQVIGVFDDLKKLLMHYDRRLILRTTLIGKRVQPEAPGLYLYGTIPVSVAGRPPQLTYVAGLMRRKVLVEVILRPNLSHPQLIAPQSPLLSKLQAKSGHFKLKEVTDEVRADLQRMLREGIQLYEKLGWI